MKLSKCDSFYKSINSILKITENEFLTIQKEFKEVSYVKNDLIIRPGELVTFNFFIIKGCVRFCFIDSKGREQTVQFGIENCWIGDYVSYYGGDKSILYIECIQDCTVLRIEKSNWEALYEEVPKIKEYTRIQLEKNLLFLQRKSITNLYMSAKEKYLNFRDGYSAVEKRIKDDYTASFLNVSKEDLIEVRKECYAL